MLITKENSPNFWTVTYMSVWLFDHDRHLCLKKWTWYAVIAISFMGLQYYSHNKNLIRLNPDRPYFKLQISESGIRQVINICPSLVLFFVATGECCFSCSKINLGRIFHQLLKIRGTYSGGDFNRCLCNCVQQRHNNNHRPIERIHLNECVSIGWQPFGRRLSSVAYDRKSNKARLRNTQLLTLISNTCIQSGPDTPFGAP